MPICTVSPEVWSRICRLNGKWDTHIHTAFASGDKDITPDLTPAHVIEAAEAIGLEGIVFTDHVRAATTWIDEYLREIHCVAESTRLQVIAGVESKIKLDGSLDIPPECMHGKWWVTASVHTFYGGKEEWIDAIYKVIKMPYVNVLGHLGTQYDGMNSDGINFNLTGDELIGLGRAIANYGKVVEINARHKLPRRSWIKAFRQQGVRFCLASDSHSLSTIGKFSSIQDLVEVAYGYADNW